MIFIRGACVLGNNKFGVIERKRFPYEGITATSGPWCIDSGRGERRRTCGRVRGRGRLSQDGGAATRTTYRPLRPVQQLAKSGSRDGRVRLQYSG